MEAEAPVAPVLSYATPVEFASEGPWRDGLRLVTTRKMSLPDRCVVCNAPADGYRLKKKLYWHHPGFYLALIHVLFYALIVLVVHRSVRVEFGLCRVHSRRRRIHQGILAMVLAFGIGCFALGAKWDGHRATRTLGGFALLTGLIVLIVGCVLTIKCGRVLRPCKINRLHAFFKGAGPEFLATLPPFQ